MCLRRLSVLLERLGHRAVADAVDAILDELHLGNTPEMSPVSISKSLQWLVHSERLPVLQSLLQSKPSIVAHAHPHTKENFLHLAIANQHMDVCATLLKCPGADWAVKDHMCGDTPLHRACKLYSEKDPGVLDDAVLQLSDSFFQATKMDNSQRCGIIPPRCSITDRRASQIDTRCLCGLFVCACMRPCGRILVSHPLVLTAVLCVLGTVAKSPRTAVRPREKSAYSASCSRIWRCVSPVTPTTRHVSNLLCTTYFLQPQPATLNTTMLCRHGGHVRRNRGSGVHRHGLGHRAHHLPA